MKSLTWGLQNVIPETAVAAWGARTILRDGFVDIVWDRTSFEPDTLPQEFKDWLEDKALVEIRKDAETIRGNDDEVYPFDDGKFHARYSAQASYGYLYITTWMEG